MIDVKLEPSWKAQLQTEFSKPYFETIVQFLRTEKTKGKTIYPQGPDIFNAFLYTPFAQTKVVILGQDPYHNPGQAHGLSFSVQEGIAPPPSLVNIFKELHSDLHIPPPTSGNLSKWAKQGVLLLNASLTVEAHQPMSHSKIGWHHFTDAVIEQLSAHGQHLVFLLWGRFAQSKNSLIDSNKHLILQAAHPSPLSAHNGFFGCKHFSRANHWLAEHHISPIDWSL